MAYKIVNDDSLTSVANAIRVQGSISGTIEFPDGFVSAIQNLSPSGNDFAVTLSWDNQTDKFVCDKTYSEVYSAYQSGKNLIACVDTTDFSWEVAPATIWAETGSSGNLIFWVYVEWSDDSEGFGYGKRHLYIFTSADGFLLADYGDVILRPQFESPSRTYTPTTSTQTETITYDASDDFNGIEEVGITVNPIPSNYKDTTDATATADKILQGYTAYAGGQKLTGTASGGITPSGTYSITSNGIYDIVSFASVDVNVSGGGIDINSVATRNMGSNISGNAPYIGLGVFAYYSLLTADFPNASFVGSSAFLECHELRTASFSSALTIQTSAFFNCLLLSEVSFPNATMISNGAFFGCSKLGVANFPKATDVSNNAFYRCTSLTSVSFPEAMIISTSAFALCSNLAEASFPKVTSVGQYAFYSCSKLSEVSFPTASYISQSAFCGCGITSLDMSATSTIGFAAFMSCSKLSVAMFSKAWSIYGMAFSGCKSLMSLYLLSDRVATLSSRTAFSSTPMSASTYTGNYGSIYVPASLVDSYKSATNWSVYADRITAYEGE